MLRKLELQNFKCFKGQSIEIGALTVLAGLNGGGKSSVIQALLILRQSYQGQYLARAKLLLDGDLVDLGTPLDVLCEEASGDFIGFALEVGDSACFRFEFDYDRKSGELLARDAAELETSAESLTTSALFSTDFSYVSADRLGPRKMAPMSDARLTERDAGSAGEYVLHSLAMRGGEALEAADLRIADASVLTVKEQVDFWMQSISPGSHIEIELVRAADLAIGAFKFDREGDVPTRGFRATNVGFGLSYALPIVFALIAARPGTLVILENPEAHLHPLGQTKLGELASRAAAMGIQVIVETHSDHFMDGVRIAVREGVVAPDKCVFNYFVRVGAQASVERPILDCDGRLSHWPVGFFDQHENNLAALLAPR